MISRRDFLRTSALGVAGVMASQNVFAAASPAAAVSATKKRSANDKINMGFIGLGQQCMHLLNGFISIDECRVVAGCDVYDVKRDRFRKRVTDYYTGKGERKVRVDMYEDYQDLLARPDIDAVVIATPDHQHAIIAVAACRAGKDVYLEKPLTLTIWEGQMLCKAVRRYNRILQVGSQQRSSEEFLHAASVVREGLLGNVERILVYVGRNGRPDCGAPVPYNLQREECPKGLNWDKWLGPMTDEVYYNNELNPVITATENEKLWGAWRWYKPTGGGYMTDWGAHMFDIVQWMLGRDGNGGPVEVIPPGYDFYRNLTYKYDNGVIVSEEDWGKGQGVKVFGENGWIEVHRGSFTTNNKALEMKAALSDSDVPFETKVGHYGTFLNSIRTRIDPNVTVETGHTSCTVCNVGNIAVELGRPVRWNPIVQKFMNDDEATRLMHYQYRDGYKLEV